MRSESIGGKEFSPRAYSVFGPKLISTRGFFQDRALESRCLTEETGSRSLREDIPINLPQLYKQESLELRNKLLMFRFRNFGKKEVNSLLVDRSIEPRLTQIFVPLLSVIEDERARDDLRNLAKEYHKELVADRGMDTEAQVLEIIQELGESPYRIEPTIKEITRRFADRHGKEMDRKVTPHWIGYVIRKKLGLKTERHDSNYVIAVSEGPKFDRLLEKYGLSKSSTDFTDSVPEPGNEEPNENAGFNNQM